LSGSASSSPILANLQPGGSAALRLGAGARLGRGGNVAVPRSTRITPLT